MSTTFLTIQETAQKLKVSPRTVRRWIKQGYLPVIKIGKTIRILEKGLVASHARLYQQEPTVDIAAASDEVFSKTWDNDEDAVYNVPQTIFIFDSTTIQASETYTPTLCITCRMARRRDQIARRSSL